MTNNNISNGKDDKKNSGSVVGVEMEKSDAENEKKEESTITHADDKKTA